MLPDNLATFAQYCGDRLGDDLRVVGSYSGDSRSVHYLREDLTDVYRIERLGPLIGKAREVHQPLHDVDQLEAPLGAVVAGVYAFENALVLHFLVGADQGVVVSVEPSVGRQLVSFLEECRRELDNELGG